MAFSKSFKILFWHSFEQSLYLLFVLCLAFGLSFVEDLFKWSNRTSALILGAHYASIFALMVDLGAWALLLIIGLYKLFTRPWNDEETEDDITL